MRRHPKSESHYGACGTTKVFKWRKCCHRVGVEKQT
nr:MAG TPA: hypothetical protein [Caudoviricetes sp.]